MFVEIETVPLIHFIVSTRSRYDDSESTHEHRGPLDHFYVYDEVIQTVSRTLRRKDCPKVHSGSDDQDWCDIPEPLDSYFLFYRYRYIITENYIKFIKIYQDI